MPGPLFDVDPVQSLLTASARAGEAMSYSEILNLLGVAFSRPKMRALCKVLDEIDRRATALDQPGLAVLIVRESDGLPGQGWWVGRTDYDGSWTGPDAARRVATLQQQAYDFWQRQSILD